MAVEVADVSDWHIVGPEQLGSSEKLWLVDEANNRWLWKATGFNEHRRFGRFRKGDDWAEWLGTEIALRLGLPAPEVRLATRHGANGSIGRSFLSGASDQQLVLGNVLLYERDSQYPVDRMGSLHEYSVEVVMEVLAGVGAPPELDDLDFDARGAMTGYLLLDALIANVDRHHENWGIVVDADGSRRLAPSFDHGSSLGFLLSDQQMQNHLDTSDRNQTVEAWARRARSRFGRRSPLDVFLEAARQNRSAFEYWIARLDQLQTTELNDVIALIPTNRMSTVARHFVSRLLSNNRDQLMSHPDGKVE